ncbi:HPr family phosphocarrier protein [Pacificimonas sp. WHA3]|uniref:HPr family phosphocarrier protein n=1 Tax=Pacificimonas pallii TaxID=2827236 RepID=A0ABS6SG92_9SPHN|nr:HPr family phosphocarrier protein [Pacificimonas pallii]
MCRPVTIRNRRGLHARASAKFVTLATDFEADIIVDKDGTTAPGRSIMSLMMLAAGPGDTVIVRGHGSDAEAAVDALVDLIEAKFGEE